MFKEIDKILDKLSKYYHLGPYYQWVNMSTVSTSVINVINPWFGLIKLNRTTYAINQTNQHCYFQLP